VVGRNHTNDKSVKRRNPLFSLKYDTLNNDLMRIYWIPIVMRLIEISLTDREFPALRNVAHWRHCGLWPVCKDIQNGASPSIWKLSDVKITISLLCHEYFFSIKYSYKYKLGMLLFCLNSNFSVNIFVSSYIMSSYSCLYARLTSSEVPCSICDNSTINFVKPI
jgi:hypothetical protein